MNKENSKKKLYIITGVLVIASIAYRIIADFRFEQTSLLFIGLPALITLIFIAYSKTPKSLYGVVFKVITIFLLMSSILLGEGVVCVLFAAPIFYGVAALIVYLMQKFNKKDDTIIRSMIILPTLLILANPSDMLQEPQVQTVVTSMTIAHTSTLEAFNNSPDFLANYPLYFNMGFPKPFHIEGNGINIGDRRDIQFESTTKGIGTLSLEVIEKNDSIIIFKPIHDNTHIDHWLTWDEMKVEIVNIDNSHSKVIWTSKYQCDLGPSWYFEPLEDITIGIMNKHLINAYFNS